jgi:ATP-dependent helicase/nuclease subunit A
VSFTRARDLVVLARSQKKMDGGWMRAIGLAQRLPADGARSMVLQDGTLVPFQRRVLSAGSADLPAATLSGNLRWFEAASSRTQKLPLIVSPSAAGESAATIIERVRIGSRIDTHAAKDRSVLGEAIHACIAADLIAGETGLPSGELLGILERFGMADVVSTAAVKMQLQAIRAWLHARWPGAVPWVEVPVSRVLPNGQRVAGRIDLLLRTLGGWILLDHKSTPQGQDRWATLAAQYGGQLAEYREAVESVTSVPVLETWLLLPVAGAAVRVSQDIQVASDSTPSGAAAPVLAT